MSARVRVTSGYASGKKSFPFRFACVAFGYMPVRKLARLGVQIGL